MVRAAAVLAIVLGLAAAPAAAQVQAPAKPQTTSLDPDAPPGAPPHWLPAESWVMQHWIPYDERRLYRLLGVDRGVIWHWLRDDTRPLADLARQRGWEPEALAARARRAVARRGRAGAARRAREARTPHAHAGPPRPASLLPLPAPGGASEPFPRDLRRREPRRVVAPAAQRDESAADLPAQRPLAQPRAAGGGTAAAPDRRLGRRAPGDPAPRRPSACSPASCGSCRAGCSRRATTARRRS